MLREHGAAPFGVVVVHGGPGAAGEMWPVARRLAAGRGVVEPMQTSMSVDGQVEELREAIESRALIPVVLVGHSWGAWLSWILTARCPGLVRKLILIGSGPFDEKYVPLLIENRLQRLTPEERDEFRSLGDLLGRPEVPAGSLKRLAELGAKTDTFDPIGVETSPVQTGASSSAIYADVWPEAARLRRTGELLQMAALVECPVVAIHGTYDPHPSDGVRQPLARTLRDFRMVLLDRCGHDPWRERQAVDTFYQLLEGELTPLEVG